MKNITKLTIALLILVFMAALVGCSGNHAPAVEAKSAENTVASEATGSASSGEAETKPAENAVASEVTGSASSGKDSDVSRLVSEGFKCTAYSMFGEKFVGIFQEPDNPAHAFKATVTLSGELYEKADEISVFDDDAKEKYTAILEEADGVIVTDISSLVPSQAELNVYIGKTLGELEQDGFSYTGYFAFSDQYTFTYDNNVISCSIGLKDNSVITNSDDISADFLRPLEIGSIEFNEFSYTVLDD